jgi:hypothetical protein
VTPDEVHDTVQLMRRRLASEHRSDWDKARRVLLPVVAAMLVIGVLAAGVGECSQSGHGVEGVLLASRALHRGR